MPRKRNADHVVMKDGVFVCEHCGDRYTPALPAPVPVFVAMTNAYVKLHRDCPAPRPPETP